MRWVEDSYKKNEWIGFDSDFFLNGLIIRNPMKWRFFYCDGRKWDRYGEIRVLTARRCESGFSLPRGISGKPISSLFPRRLLFFSFLPQKCPPGAVHERHQPHARCIWIYSQKMNTKKEKKNRENIMYSKTSFPFLPTTYSSHERQISPKAKIFFPYHMLVGLNG